MVRTSLHTNADTTTDIVINMNMRSHPVAQGLWAIRANHAGSIQHDSWRNRPLSQAGAFLRLFGGFWLGIELGRAGCRRRVATLVLSVARWVHNSAVATFSEARYHPGQHF
jgi:hypothetical protein